MRPWPIIKELDVKSRVFSRLRLPSSAHSDAHISEMTLITTNDKKFVILYHFYQYQFQYGGDIFIDHFAHETDVPQIDCHSYFF